MRGNMVDALNLALRQEMAKDSTVIVLGEDVGVDGGVFRVTDGLLKKYGQKRVIDTPLAESGIVGTAIGLAVAGFRPVVEIQFSGFTYPAIDQLISHAARIRNRSRGRYHCPLVVRTPYGGGIRALEHHSESLEAIYVHAPGLRVVIPSTPEDAKGLLISAIRDNDPVIFYEPKRIYRAIKEEIPEKEYTIPIGKANVCRSGADVTVLSWGAHVRECVEAAEKVKESISVEVIDLRTLFPVDKNSVITSVKKTGRCVVVHEAPRTAGFGAELIAIINEYALLYLEAPIKRVTGYDVVFPYFKLEKDYLPNTQKIINAITEVAKF